MATEFEIADESLTGLKDKVIIVTGSSSGIGLATVQLLLSLGAKVVGGDLAEPPEGGSDNFTFFKTNVAEWRDQVSLFKEALKLHGHIDHVYANAGVGSRTNYVDGIELDENGDPKEPTSFVLDINLKSMVHTATLGVHYLRRESGGQGGSIVINASVTGLTRFRAVDYSVAKHGTIGLIRGLHTTLISRALPVRINGVAVSWTGTGMVPQAIFDQLGIYTQPPSAVARAVALLMADESRKGHIIHVDHGVYKEIDEAVLLPAYKTSIVHPDTLDEDETVEKMFAAAAAQKQVEEASK